MSASHPACDCAWTRAATDAWVDDELATDQVAELERALATCEACRAYRDGLVHYKALVGSVPTPPLPVALAARLSLPALERRARELTPRPPRSIHAARAAGALAAGFLAWVAFGTVSDRFAPRPPVGAVVRPPVLDVPTVPADPPPSPEALLLAFGEAVELAEHGATIEAFARFERIRIGAGTRVPGELAPKALFWTARLAPTLAEALARYDALARDHAASPLAATALGAAAAVCDRLGRNDEARVRRVALVRRHPASAEARDAALALVRLGAGELRDEHVRWLRTHAPDSPQTAAALRETGGEGSND